MRYPGCISINCTVLSIQYFPATYLKTRSPCQSAESKVILLNGQSDIPSKQCGRPFCSKVYPPTHLQEVKNTHLISAEDRINFVLLLMQNFVINIYNMKEIREIMFLTPNTSNLTCLAYERINKVHSFLFIKRWYSRELSLYFYVKCAVFTKPVLQIISVVRGLISHCI